MIEADPAQGTMKSLIIDNELIIYVHGCLNFDAVGVTAIEFVPEYGDVSKFNRVCIDLSAATLLEIEGLDYLNKFYHAAKEANLSFRVSGVTQIMIRVFAMAGVTWTFEQRAEREVTKRRVRRQINLKR